MGKIIISTLISILPFTQLSHPHEEDPFTTYIQEKLIELGYLEVATGVNDKTSQAAIKLFQEKSGLIVDGMVGENTFLKLMLAEKPIDNNSSVTSSSASTSEAVVQSSVTTGAAGIATELLQPAAMFYTEEIRSETGDAVIQEGFRVVGPRGTEVPENVLEEAGHPEKQ